MARKLHELKFLQEMGATTEVNNRRLTSQFVPCFVPFQPHSKIYPPNYPPKRRLEIAIEVKPGAEIPSPVKIIHSVQDWDSGLPGS